MKTPSRAISWTQRVCTMLATMGGVGRCPVASGTAGSAVTVGLYFLLMPMDPLVQLGVIAVVIALGLWSSDMVASVEGKDPSCVVIDEMAGMLIAAFMLPHSPLLLFSSFLLFRVFDIGKWFPMKQLERLPGGWGIVADDLAAGLLARLCLLPWV